MNLSELFLCFFFYSFLGWLYESLVCSIFGERRFINRGFLLGPYCPIYGTGSILCWLVLKDNANMLEVFAIAAVLCCVVEYITSFCMEKVFHARWWDYSSLPFQLHGRICLYGGIIFGGGVVIVKFLIQPTLLQMTTQLNQSLLDVLAVVIFAVAGIDILVTLGSWKGLNKHLSIIHNAIYDKADGTFSKLTDKFWDTPISSVVEKGHGIFIRVQNINVRLSSNELHFFRAFPNIHIPAYEEIIKRLSIKEKMKMNSETKEHQEVDCTPDTSVEDVIQ
ncbi:putative ABC transporter permease [Youngiibacter fragilis]|uniref:Membrane protein n=1 Tax=Youngiibacter fragilis 232.1 TaxID=994573 RepID=V7I8W2_9CLOT|nr:putative ABC transporter permease [Youngiibacter fragilis]ETA81706.1 membrane protein [Youngiibacter fragilis 232.1]